MNSINIREGTFQNCVHISERIPEFTSPYGVHEYKKRCNNIHLILIADVENNPVGFKVGYDRFSDESFYSWMGGVLPNFRRMGVAEALAEFQEKWAVENGFKSIKLKTRQKHKAMIQFSLNRGFMIIEKINKEPTEETRIWMEKALY